MEAFNQKDLQEGSRDGADRLPHGGDMAVKPNAKLVIIKEQIIEDPASGLTLMFSVYSCGTMSRLRICGDALPYGNRDFIFGESGELGGGGTATGGICEKMSWLQVVSEDESGV